MRKNAFSSKRKNNSADSKKMLLILSIALAALSHLPVYADSFATVVSGDQAAVTGFANLNTTQFERDTKVDAVLQAKKVFDDNPKVARVTVRFFYPDKINYVEVAVTTGDVLAFGTGKLPKEKLLESLTLIRVTKKDFKESTSTKINSYTSNILSFAYPSNWLSVPPMQNPRAGLDETVEVELVAKHSIKKSKITFERYAGAMTLTSRANLESNLNKASIVAPISIGRNRNLPALTWVSHQQTPYGEIFSRRIYFKLRGEKLSVTLACLEAEAKTFEPSLSYILSTIH